MILIVIGNRNFYILKGIHTADLVGQDTLLLIVMQLFRVAEDGTETSSQGSKKQKLEDGKCEEINPAANPEKESLICRLEAAKPTAICDLGYLGEAHIGGLCIY